MARFDRLIEGMVQRQVESAFLVGGEPMQVFVNGQRMEGSVISADQLLQAVLEVAPPELRPDNSSLPSTFTYNSPHGGYVFNVEPYQDTLQVTLSATSPVSPSGDTQRLQAELASSDFRTRVKAMAMLREAKELSAVPMLIELLQDRDSRVREEAAYSLERVGDERAVEPLIAALHDVEGDVRLKVARALGALGDARAVQPLIVHLRDPDDGVRFYAAQALGNLGDPAALEPLRVTLKNTSSSHETAQLTIERAIATLELASSRPSVQDRPLEDIVLELYTLLTEGGSGHAAREARMREIGEDLDRRGGIDLMRKAFYAVRNKGCYCSEDGWDGIGDWRS